LPAKHRQPALSLFDSALGLFGSAGNQSRRNRRGACRNSERRRRLLAPANAPCHNILRCAEVRVDAMVPRADIEAVEITTTLGDLPGTFEQSGHSRMPVYSETPMIRAAWPHP
jgi:CBS domain containing-hemolysin-like protein